MPLHAPLSPPSSSPIAVPSTAGLRRRPSPQARQSPPLTPRRLLRTGSPVSSVLYATTAIDVNATPYRTSPPSFPPTPIHHRYLQTSEETKDQEKNKKTKQFYTPSPPSPSAVTGTTSIIIVNRQNVDRSCKETPGANFLKSGRRTESEQDRINHPSFRIYLKTNRIARGP
ncbi:hypothetical protein JYU34_015695 [Plutella xylostella]|uniref:Uncharacterized protein n=1 Tax=Plutella xylostella TaxID=51655 RepID=A0ABQ7Q4I0_PLUXY|nr:hypothetical protein JYU34_015695 [Plutella xylostella]